MPLGLGTAFWAICLPVEATNLVTNPSLEYGTTGWGTYTAGTIGTTSQYQQFGAWSGSYAPTSNGTAGVMSPTWVATSGSSYSVSAYVRGANGIPYIFAVSDINGQNIGILGTVAFTGGGTWQRYNVSYTENFGGVRRLLVRKDSSADTSAIYIDGVQASAGSLTTFFSGDDGGGTWQGAPHNSTSFRTGQYRGGGSVIALADLGLSVNDMIGAGMPPIENSFQSYAVLDGAQYQRTRAKERTFTLTAKPIFGTSTADFHITRRTIIDALKIDLVTPQQPTRFYYVGGQGTVQIDAVYDRGLELGAMNGPMAEDVAVGFVAYQPYWEAPTQQGTTLGVLTSLGSTNFIVKRLPTGAWGTLGSNGTTINYTTSPSLTSVESMAMNDGGTLFIGGLFGTVAGTMANAIAMYYPQTNTFGTLVGGTVGPSGGDISGLAIAPSGSVYFGGVFGSVGGTVAPRVAFWNGAGFGTLTGGTIDNANPVNKVLYSPTGTLFIGGQFQTAGGTTAPRIAMWANGSFGTLSQGGGTLTGQVLSLTWALDSSLYVGGGFDKAGGTAAGSVARWNGAWGTLGAGANDVVRALATKPDGRIAAGGNFTTMGGVTVNGVAEWSGAGWQADGAGISGGGAALRAVAARSDNSLIVAGDFTSAGGISTPDPIALWTGAAYQPIGIDLPGTPIIYAVLEAPDKTLYMAGSFAGAANAAVYGSVVNTGRAPAYPTLRLRNLSSGTAKAYYLLNTTTGAGLYFNLSLLAGEVATLELTPGNRSFVSSFRPNLFSAILPGSNLATWALLPGTNSLSFFGDNSSLEASLFWTPRSWSADGGTVY